MRGKMKRYASAGLALLVTILTGATAALAVPAYNPPGMDVGAPNPTPTKNGVKVPLTFSNTPNWNISPKLQKFVDTLAPLGCTTTNNLGQCIPVATPDIVTYPGSDYYEIEVVQYTEKMHSQLSPTTLRGYRQINQGTNTSACTDPSLGQPNPCTTADNTVAPPAGAHYLGPMIIAQKDRPVRIKLVNNLPVGSLGDLFVPVDESLMGAGQGPLKADGTPCTMTPAAQAEPGSGYLEHAPDCAKYPQNRAELHLHGGLSPWISDGTPHQWIAPAAEITPYKRGVSAQNVPDMPDPGPGAVTYYYTNQQSARLMFYHDHTVGLTRLNVYVGEAAGYLITDPVEQDLISRGLIPSDQIPLIIQDKSFVDPATIAQKDPTWVGKWGTDNPVLPGTVSNGDLWWPHVYMVAENPYVLDGINPMGRWVYGLWFWPPTTNIPYQLEDNPYYDPACDAGPTAPGCVTELAFEPPKVPKFPLPSWVAEAFLDTMMVNGTVYPTLTVDPKAYRFRILNAAHDRFLNLQLYEATTTINQCTITNGGSGYTVGDILTFQGNHHAGKYPSDAELSVTAVDGTGAITGFRIDNYGSMYNPGPLTFDSGAGGILADVLNPAATGAVFSCTTQSDTEVAMVPAVNYREYAPLNKQYIPNDNREGGVPNPTLAGPSWLQIGNESGFLAKPVVLPNYPVTFLTDPTMFNVGNVMDGTLRMGPAERADVIIDFCQYAGKTLILYNDAPAAYPAAVANNDYYTGAPDLSDAGGASEVIPGYGPNTRTVMQIKVNPGACTPFDSAPLFAEFSKATTSDPSGKSVFERGQEPIIVGQEYYNDVYGMTFPWRKPNWGISEIGDNYLHYFDPVLNPPTNTTATTTYMQPKAIHDEMGGVYDEYGRMSARLGVEVPLTFALNQTFVMQSYVDPPTEIVGQDEVQIWKITHNGVDTHPMHFHLFDVQVINRVGWDGFKRLPDDNERGWKETVKISPLEDTIVALRPRAPKVPFGLPDSIRHLAPALPPNTTQYFTNLQTSGPNVGQAKNPLDNNQIYNFGDEYVWHCHILSHEEQDMMRPIQFNTVKIAPDPFSQTTPTTFSGGTVTVAWNDPTPVTDANTPGNPKNEIGFRIERCGTTNPAGCGAGDTFTPVVLALANQTSYTDTTLTNYPYYTYRVVAWNAAGETVSTNMVTTGTIDVIPGACGPSHGGTFTAAPTTGLCAYGAPSAVTGTGPWTWNCDGVNGGAQASCSANIQQWLVSFAVNANGTLTGDTLQLVNHGGNSTAVLAVPVPGYQFLSWKDGLNAIVSTVPSFTATNVTANQFYTAFFYVPKDYNNDGKADLLWTNDTTNETRAWLMDNTTRLLEVTLPAPPAAVAPARFVIQAAADFNHDGQTDLLYRNQTTGQTVLRLMNGINTLSDVTIPSLNVNWEVAGAGDFNGDGHTDILWRRHDRDTNNLFAWYMNNTTVTASSPYMENLNRIWRVGGVADFNGDGKADILWRRTDTDTNNSMIWMMNGVVRSSTVTLPNLNRNWRVGAVADLNRDGNPDIVWRRYDRDTSNTYYWYMNGAGAPTGASPYLPNQPAVWTMVGR